jgi:hypothetical protein
MNLKKTHNKLPLNMNSKILGPSLIMLGSMGLFLTTTQPSVAIQPAPSSRTTIDVTVARTTNGFTLMRDGLPFFIKGAGGSGSKSLLKSCGANSFRTWGADTLGDDLKEAEEDGLTVAAGIWLGHKDQGFNYNDPAQILDQRQKVTEVVSTYKNSPSLLLWSLGNEMEGDGRDPVVWKEIEYLAKMVKQIDPHHPVMTVICEPIDKKIKFLDDYCPDVDIVGINAYASAPTVADRYAAAAGTKPYILTEFGPPGQWEQPKTAWGASIEMSSTAKADWYKRAYTETVLNRPMCLGSYAFLWGTKQEATATWYGMLLPSGDQLESVDTMRELWTGRRPTVTPPKIHDFEITGSTTVAPGATLHAKLDATDNRSGPLQFNWVVRADKPAEENGGAPESALANVPGAVVWSSAAGAVIKAPDDPGAYRLFVYLHGSHDQAAVANVPFFVSSPTADAADDSSNGLLKTASLSKYGIPVAHLPYVVYGQNGKMSPNFAPSGYMGNTSAVQLDASNKSVSGPTGGVSLKCTYNAGDRWAGVVWQSPANDWGNLPGGVNLSGAQKLSFWARGARGGETVSFQYGLLGVDKRYHDTSSAKLANVVLTNQWKHYQIDLSGKNLADIKTCFAWVVAGTGAPITFYLDNIQYQ